MIAPYYEQDGCTIYHGDFAEIMADLPSDSIEAVITDPPYPKEYLPLWEPLAEQSARLNRASLPQKCTSGNKG
jgi:DNA modification methylase